MAVINTTLARKYFPGEDPIGRRLADTENGHPSTWEVVGVVDDVREAPLDAGAWPTEYFPISQTLDHSFSLAIRASQDERTLLPLLASALHQVDPNLGISDEATLDAKIGTTQAALLHRFAAWLVGGFACMALALSVTGLYGVIAYSVSQRTREIGVRMALGAQRSAVYGMVLREAGRLIAIGIVAGVVVSVAATSLMRRLLFGVEPWDVSTMAAVVVVLAVFAVLASFIPARRAASVNPVEALRAE